MKQEGQHGTISLLIVVQFMDAVGLGLLIPILPFYLESVGGSPQQVTLLVATYAFAGLLMSPIIGRIGDRYPKKIVVLVALLGSTLSYIGLVFSVAIVAVFVFRFIGGAAAAKGSVLNAWAVALVPGDERAKYLGQLGAARSAGMMAGPMFGGFLTTLEMGLEPYQNVFVGAIVASVLVGLFGLIFLPNASSAPKRNLGADGDPMAPIPVIQLIRRVRMSIQFGLGLAVAFSVVMSSTALYVSRSFGWGPVETGYLLGLMTGLIAFARVLGAQRIFRRFGLAVSTKWAYFATSLGLLACVLWESWIAFVIFFILACVSYAIALIGSTVMLSSEVPEDNVGYAMGLLAAASSGVVVLGAAVHGYLFETFGPSSPFLVSALLMLLIASLFPVHSIMSKETRV